jgi:Na+/H+ antiporter NhaC
MESLILLLPPLIALSIAIVFRHIYAALLAGIFACQVLLEGLNVGSAFLSSIDRIASVFSDPGNVNVLLFCLLIGILISYMRDSGGVSALANAMLKGPLSRTRRRAELSVATIGTGIFVETNISLLGTGILGRPLYDAYNLSRERLAYIIDSTSSPVSVILLLNAWGAYADRLIEPYGFENSTSVVVGSIPWNFYAFIALFLAFFTAVSGKVFGPLKNAKTKSLVSAQGEDYSQGKPIFMWLPIIILVGGSFGFMYLTGNGDVTKGSGSQSILWAISAAILSLAFLLKLNRVFDTKEMQEKAFSGMSEMLPAVTILVLAIAFGSAIRELGTGDYVADVATDALPTFLLPAILFLVAAAVSFITGTSWGTYGILIPVAIPIALSTGIPPSLTLAAVLGGGVFGDHCSPISDTTLIASIAADCDHIRHVETQLPYAIASALVAFFMYVIAGSFFA